MGTQRTRAARAWSTSRAAALLVLATGHGVAGAAAEPAPRYDPDSSAGVEYALPLGQAREQTGAKPSGGGSVARSGADDELFGEGITPATQGERHRPAVGGAGSKTPAAGGGIAPAGSESVHAAPVDAGPGGLSAVLVGAISAAAVALLAGALALLLRMRGSNSARDAVPGR